ncbi:homocysteine S-methyltransferase family protein [Enterococcus asini]|uniref:homocysteine S-methyltransferase family protein n=1 Tax=Enterococcus asini TaxID=57732 RepID=UPI0026DABE1C|nr:homocysteine S-methyltransferase family protein [Enterococcus asini]
MKLKEALQTGFLLFDGAMGTMLQEKGLAAGMQPEYFNLTHPEVVTEIHRQYVAAGADIITANTFQANGHKIPEAELPKIITAAVKLAKDSGARFVAYDMGPIGALLAPLGTLSFDEAYELFAQQARLAERAGADLVILETVSDLLEAKAAILAIKENTDLPVFATMTYQADGRTFVGCDPVTATLTLQVLGVDALGVNCSLGPKELLPVVEEITRYAQVPVVVQANAGLPEMENGATVYRLTPAAYLAAIAPMLDLGVTVVGGCCGTTPTFTSGLRELLDSRQPVVPVAAKVTAVTSGVQTVILDERLTVIGERLNPTGKKRLQAAIRQKDLGYLLKEGIQQVTDGGDILDVNVGLPEIDEAAMMQEVIPALQSVVNVPLQIDSSSVAAIEAGARIYNGRPLINSVNGKPETMQAIFPIAKKYGALVLGLTLDATGIPKTAAGRLQVARRIVETGASYGIPKEDILIDPLVLTASAQQDQVQVTLDTLKLVKAQLGVQTVAGVSNVSFGLPNRPLLNSTFLAAAVGAGLSAPILNPGSQQMMATVATLRVINHQDKDAQTYIEKSQAWQFGPGSQSGNGSTSKAKDARSETPANTVPKNQTEQLRQLILQGRKEETPNLTRQLLAAKSPLEIVNEAFIPALDEVGQKFEAGTLFLPQLMQSAEAVKGAQELLKDYTAAQGETASNQGRILLATVAGDIHDIGKNIVKMIMENYGFQVVDLGKDVPIERVVATIQKEDIKLVGLSALMTTTVQNMKATIKAVRDTGLECTFIVGGAVLNEDYREFVGADYYAKDALESVKFAQAFFEQHPEWV